MLADNWAYFLVMLYARKLGVRSQGGLLGLFLKSERARDMWPCELCECSLLIIDLWILVGPYLWWEGSFNAWFLDVARTHGAGTYTKVVNTLSWLMGDSLAMCIGPSHTRWTALKGLSKNVCCHTTGRLLCKEFTEDVPDMCFQGRAWNSNKEIWYVLIIYLSLLKQLLWNGKTFNLT